MLNRRRLLSTWLAFGAAASAGPTLAHSESTPFVLPEEFLPREVKLQTVLPPGEIHVDPNRFALFWTLPDNGAIRYAVGIGRGNLYHPGTFVVGAKRKWPSWKPTPAMILRDPGAYGQFAEGQRYQNGQPGGVNNPLGARALYLYKADGSDTYLRIHGTNAPQTIGTAVSNGCARLINDQVSELYERVPVGAKVVLYKKAGGQPAHSSL